MTGGNRVVGMLRNRLTGDFSEHVMTMASFLEQRQETLFMIRDAIPFPLFNDHEFIKFWLQIRSFEGAHN